jgi:sugar lactone lactonase YvrE
MRYENKTRQNKLSGIHLLISKYGFEFPLLGRVVLLAVLLCGYFCPANAQIITTIADTAGISGFGGDGGSALSAMFTQGDGDIICDGNGNIYIADLENHRIRLINNAHIVSTFAGVGTPGFSGDGGPAMAAQIDSPVFLARDGFGNLYISDPFHLRIRKIAPTGIITTVAGTGVVGYTGDGGPATAARINGLYRMAADAAGNLYFTDIWNIRKIDASGIITTIAGSGSFGFSGDGGPATLAQLRISAGSLATDASGNLYVADYGNECVRKIDASGTITTIAGIGLSGGFSGDGGPATAALFRNPGGLAFDHAGNLYVMDQNNHRIRKVDPSGIVTTVAGTGTAGYSGDGGPATAAKIYLPHTTTDCTGNLILFDVGLTSTGSRVRIINFGHAPAFTAGHTQSFSVCKNAPTTSINSLLAVALSDIGRTETWSVLTTPAHGSAVASYTTTSTGGVLMPTGLSYMPAAGYVGMDTFSVIISDCGYLKDTTTVYVTVADCALSTHGTTSRGVSSLRISPNPNNGSFTVHVSSGVDMPVRITVTNILGQKVKEITAVTNKDVPLQLRVPKGMYFVNAVSERWRWSEKILVE